MFPQAISRSARSRRERSLACSSLARVVRTSAIGCELSSILGWDFGNDLVLRLPGQLRELGARVRDVSRGFRNSGRMGEERPEVRHRVIDVPSLQQQEGEPVVGSGGVRLQLQHPAVGPHRLIGHADVRVRYGDLLEYVRIAGGLAQREAEGCQSFVVLLLAE